MYSPDRFQEFFPQLALHEVCPRSSFESPRNLNVSRVSRQHDNSRFGKLAANRSDGVNTVHVWHLQVHEGYVRLIFSKQVERFAPVGGFANQFHILFAPDQGSDAVAEERVIVYCQDSNHFLSHFPLE
jgi:hypothetical protein